jgi:hypothetical protein
VIKAVYGCDPEEARISHRNWEVVSSWMDKEIPLRMILQTVEDMKQAGRPVHSLRYIKPIVEKEVERALYAARIG